jgi:hypothetical protein
VIPPFTVITVAPAPDDADRVFTVVADCVQVGASRVCLPPDLPDREQLAATLCRDLGLVVVDSPDPATDLAAPALDGPALVAAVAQLLAGGARSIRSSGARTLPVLLATLAAGGDVWLDAPGAVPVGAGVRDLPGLTARAGGLARIAGRPPIGPAELRALPDDVPGGHA